MLLPSLAVFVAASHVVLAWGGTDGVSRPRPDADAWVQPSRSLSLLQGRMYRTWTPASAATTSTPSVQSVSNATRDSRRRRRTVAALQTRSQRVNCSGAVEPCLPYQEFAETTVARSSSLLREEGQSGSVAPKQTLAVTGAKAILEGNRTDMPGDETVLDLSDGSSAGQFDEAWQSQLWKTMLPVELHIPSVSIEALLDEVAYGKAHIDFEGTFGKNESLLLGSGGRSIAELLQQLRAELSTTCEIPEHRLVMNSIHGRFIRPAAATSSPFQSYRGLFPVASSKSGSSFTTGLNQEERLGEEVLVRFFVSPGQASAENMDGEKKAVRKVVEHLQSALRNPRSSLMKGKLSKLLSQSSLTVGYQESYAYQAPQKIEKLSNLALPFVISAFFTGVLIWLASW